MLRVVFRADATSAIGTGHVMRSLALAQECVARGWGVMFRCQTDSPWIRKRLAGGGVGFVEAAPGGTVEDLAGTRAAVSEFRADWVVTDGYAYAPAYLEALGRAGARVLLIDDYGHLPDYPVSMLVNQNIGAERIVYRLAPTAAALLGPRYALLRREFVGWTGRRRNLGGTVRHLLVTLGGADPDNVTLKVLQALRRVTADDLVVRVLAGPANPHRESLEKDAGAIGKRVELLTDVHDMPACMDWAELAISAAGSTCWELCFMGLTAILIVLADNQVGVAEGLAAAGAIINGGGHSEITAASLAAGIDRVLCDEGLRRSCSVRGRALVDGRGAARVADAMERLAA
jgi:UDP-2,4-diacetamido-2,4,6-trideoxy-beta-L-altropyranose hydrolase